MKRLCCVVLAMLLLCGCRAEDSMDQALQLRSRVLSGACSFDAQIMADYGDVTYTFTLACVADREGNLSFTVTQPESISGITGKLGKEGGKLTFDDVALSFPMLAEELITPVAAPWAFLTALRGGYIQTTGADGAYTRLTVSDSFESHALTLDIWLAEDQVPVQADVIWENRRIVSMQIRNFVIG